MSLDFQYQKALKNGISSKIATRTPVFSRNPDGALELTQVLKGLDSHSTGVIIRLQGERGTSLSRVDKGNPV